MRKLKKPFQEIVKLEKFVPGGQTLGVLADGRKVFVWGALPGETARIEIYKIKKSYAEAVAVEILESSPHRIEPHDDCYLSTSPWQIMDYDYELSAKADLVQEVFLQQGIDLRRHSGLDPESSNCDCHSGLDPESSNCDVIASNTKQSTGNPTAASGDVSSSVATDNNDFFYRNKMEYSLWWDNEKSRIELAFHKRGSHQKIPVRQSSIERPEIFAEAQRIVEELNVRKEEARKYQSLLVRCNQNGEVSSALFENNKPHPIMKNLTDDILGQKYSYSPNGFFQINLPVYEMALQDIAKHLGNTEKVVDMYAGVGTIGLSVARNRELTLVETDKSAFQELLRNASGKVSAKLFSKDSTPSDDKTYIPDVPDRFVSAGDGSAGAPAYDVLATDGSLEKTVLQRPIDTIHAKSEEALDYITNDITLILDPPRAGLDERVVAKILDTKPPVVIYLSCNPATQARDIAKLLEQYKITHHRAFNFFPRTPHIENLVILKRLC